MTEIIENLFVGGLDDAHAGFDGLIVCMMTEKPSDEPPDAIWIPLFANGIASLERAAETIDDALRAGCRVLVHCTYGSERSPLTVAWFLHRRRAMTIDQAYAMLKRKRPMVEDRRAWLEPYL